jgi:hypothetical protein
MAKRKRRTGGKPVRLHEIKVFAHGILGNLAGLRLKEADF